MAVRSLVVDISAATAGLQSGVNNAVSLLSTLGTAADRYGRNFDRAISSAMQSAGASVRAFTVSSNQSLSNFYAAQDTRNKAFAVGWGRLGDDITSVGKKLTIGLTLPLALLGGRAFQTYAQIDALKLGLENITGSAAGATARFSELRAVAALPGLGLEEAVQGDVRLQAVGFSARTSKDALLQFGNALALTGGGKFELGNVITQLTQMGGKAKVLAEDLKPITTASPAVAKAIKDMFGTVDSEQISAKLQAAGRGPKEFITDLIAKLGELERVKSGPKNALENVSDALKIAEYNFGAAADKAFGLTGIINSVGNAATSLADRFSTLSPAMQRVILTVGGVALVAGPLLLAIGGIIAIIPSLITGWTAVSGVIGLSLGPIGLTVIAITATVAAIYAIGNALNSYNANLQTTADKSSILANITNQVADATAGETSKLQSLLSVARDETISKKARLQAVSDLNALSPQYLGNIRLETINTAQATNAINSYTNALTLKAKVQSLSQQAADAQIAADRAAAKSARDFVDRGRFSGDRIATNIKTVFSFNAQGDGDRLLDDLGKRRKDAEVKRAQDTSRIINSELKKAYTDAAKTGVAVQSVAQAKPFDYSGIDPGGSGIEKAKDKLKSLKDAIASGNLAGKDTSALQAEYATLSAQIDKATASTKRHSAAVAGSLNPSLTANEQILKRLSYELRSQGETASPELRKRVALFTELVQAGKDLTNLKPVDLGNLKQIGEGNTLQRASAALSDFLSPLQRLPGLLARVGEIKAYESLDYFRSGIEKLKANIADLSFSNLAIPQSTMDSLARYIGEVNRVDRAVANKVGLAEIKADNDAGGNAPNVVAVQRMLAQMQGMKGGINTSINGVVSVMQSGRAALGNAAGVMLTGIGDAVGKGENPIKAALKSILTILGDYLIQVGTSLLLAASFSAAAAAFPSPLTPFLAATGVNQYLAGGLMVAGGAAVKAIPFAQGGTVSGPTYSMTGEYPGASRNPEFIAPASKGAGLIAEGLMKMGGFGGGGGNLTATVKGTDLEFVLERSKRSQKATGNG